MHFKEEIPSVYEVFYTVAELIPEYKKIVEVAKQYNSPKGELYLIDFLEKNLDSSFEIYFQPNLNNGSRPDIIIMKKGYGVLIIEVKDYNLDCYIVNDDGSLSVKGSSSKELSPIAQVKEYKDAMFDIHIQGLCDKKIKDKTNYGIIDCAVYFHDVTKEQLAEKFHASYDHVDLLCKDNLEASYFSNKLRYRDLFTDEIYYRFRNFMKPTVHTKDEGNTLHIYQNR